MRDYKCRMTETMAKEIQDIDQDVLVKMAAADPSALGLLYDIYYDKIFRYCIHRLRYRQVAEDVTSSIFLSAAAGIKKFRGKTRGQFACWLYMIAGNHINQHLRENQRREKLLRLAKEKESQKQNNNHEPAISWPRLHSAILKLDADTQTLITLRYFEGFTSAKVAEMIKANPNTVRVRLSRAIEKLRFLLSQE